MAQMAEGRIPPGLNLAVSGSIFDPLLGVTRIDGYVANNK